MKIVKKLFSTGLVWLWIAVLLIVIDHVSKYLAVKHLPFAEPVEIFSFFNLTLVYNTGAAFNFLHEASGWQNYVLGSIAYIVSIVILYWLYKLSAREIWLSTALCLILGGALGNAWDRGMYGYVVDFFDFHWGKWHFAIFNVADSAICIGAFMLIAHWILYPKYCGDKAR